MEDAYPLGYGGRELQTGARYDKGADGEDQFLIQPRLEMGIAPNWQAAVTVPFQFEPDGKSGLSDVTLDAFYNFNTEGLITPAFSAALGLDLPTGSKSSGVDPNLTLIATKTLGVGQDLERLHVNLSYFVNSKPRTNERDDGVSAVLGFSRRYGSETMLLADIVYEQEKDDDDEIVLIELGARYQTTPRNLIVLGFGAGINDASPDFRMTVGFQQAF